jgi:glycyl-tRNA synthetase beta chain
MRYPLLVEIGVEELPNGHLKLAVEVLKKSLPEAFKKARLGFEGLEVYGTPRRLVISINELETRQLSQEIHVVGPAKAAALDVEGKPTKAYLGFLKSQKAADKEVSFREIPNKKGEYLVLERKIPGKSTINLLPDLTREQIGNIPFTRKMRWESVGANNHSPLQFSRPIRWLLVFFGDKPILLALGSIRSSNVTYGHRLLHPKPARIKSIPDYFEKMEQFKIILSPEKRRQMIRQELKKESPSFNEEEYRDLIEETANLVETPFFFRGKLSHHFLELPQEVLAASMSKYQRIFALREKDGKLRSSFLAVLNGKPARLDIVKKHYEWVLNARLVDSLFFFKEDQKLPKGDTEILGSKLSALKDVNFHEGLGSLYDKSFRLEKLCQEIAEKDLKWNREKRISVQQAAIYSKCDLLTKMVYEFPSLQGVMGHMYLLLDKTLLQERLHQEGLSKESIQAMAQAIEEQYYPKGAGQLVPQTEEGAILAIADRLDTLVGFFGKGIYPTGSEDPFGLRRAATGLIRILLEKKIPVSIDNLIDRSISSYNSSLNPAALGNSQELKQKVSEFLKERLAIQLREAFGSTGLVEAVLSSGSGHLADLLNRLFQLNQALDEPYFQQAAKVQERTQNIVRAAKGAVDHSGVREDLLVEDAEKELWRVFAICRGQAELLIKKGEYQQATKIYGTSLYEPIHTFFDQVLVNAEDEEIRENRLKLCGEIYAFYACRVADLSKLRTAVDREKNKK